MCAELILSFQMSFLQWLKNRPMLDVYMIPGRIYVDHSVVTCRILEPPTSSCHYNLTASTREEHKVRSGLDIVHTLKYGDNLK